MQALDAGKATILKALHATFGAAERQAGFQCRAVLTLAAFLTRKDPLASWHVCRRPLHPTRAAACQSRDKDHGGIVTNFDQLATSRRERRCDRACRGYSFNDFRHSSMCEIVGPKVGAELRRQAVVVTLYALAECWFILHFASSGCTVLPPYWPCFTTC